MLRRKPYRLKLPARTLALGQRTLVMGVLNVTPDSFSDGGKFFDPQRAIDHALAMEQVGADLLDIGGESTRPDSGGTPAEEELQRVLPVLEALRGRLKIPISIDTQKAGVAEAALAAGAELINDISGLKNDPRIAEVAVRHRVPLILMHMRGEPRTMQKKPFARDVLKDVAAGLRAAAQRARRTGVPQNQIVLDPGIGFGKSFRQNYELLARLPELARLGFPLLVGVSRKQFLGATLAPLFARLARDAQPLPSSERIWGTAAAVTACILGGAHIVRVHDVAEMAQVARVADCLLDPRKSPRNR
ncbi:MAG: dihydropteroate synthase [Acidobacteriia bacterium]|nr:dihydropteroate synthase [Terriglobia bacterium]